GHEGDGRQPRAPPGHPAPVGRHLGLDAAGLARQRGRPGRRLHVQRRGAGHDRGGLLLRVHLPGPDPGPLLRPGQGRRLRIPCCDGRLLQGLLLQGWSQGGGGRREPGGRRHLHPHLLRKLHPDHALLRLGPPEVL
ncbi:MAG: Conserved hypothetical integral membrane protein YrbEa, partial [uncultured Acidimicrobiales bacterium]